MNDKELTKEHERISRQLRDAATAAVEAMIQARIAGSIADSEDEGDISGRAGRAYADALADLDAAVDALADIGGRFSGVSIEAEAASARRIEDAANKTKRTAEGLRGEAENI